MKDFFVKCDFFDYMVTRPLSHIKGNWELSWDGAVGEYRTENDSYASEVNKLIYDLEQCTPPQHYHDNEDRLAEYVRDNLGWPLIKVGNRWEGQDYRIILQSGGFHDLDEANLVLAAAGRIMAAKARHQNSFDEMEQSHQKMLAAVLSIILYHRSFN